MKQHVTLVMPALTAALCLHLTSCATQNSPMQQAIAQRVQNSMVLGPAAGLLGGGVAVAKSAFNDFYSAPLATTPQGGAQ